MNKPQQQKPAKMPGDHLSSTEERTARESTLLVIKDELEAERSRNAAHDKAMAEKLAGSDLHLAQMHETEAQRARAFAETVQLVKSEMDAQLEVNPPRSPPRGIDDASIALIKAEMDKSRKRVVLPSG